MHKAAFTAISPVDAMCDSLLACLDGPSAREIHEKLDAGAAQNRERKRVGRYFRSPDLVPVVFAGEGKRNEPEK